MNNMNNTNRDKLKRWVEKEVRRFGRPSLPMGVETSVVVLGAAEAGVAIICLIKAPDGKTEHVRFEIRLTESGIRYRKYPVGVKGNWLQARLLASVVYRIVKGWSNLVCQLCAIAKSGYDARVFEQSVAGLLQAVRGQVQPPFSVDPVFSASADSGFKLRGLRVCVGGRAITRPLDTKAVADFIRVLNTVR